MRFALIGQPNSGKSTLFNQVSGYRAETGNFAGTTVTYTESKVRVYGSVVDLVDLPGTYSLSGMNPAERVTLEYLTSREVDVIINVIDATHITQGLSLSIELLEMQKPLIIGLNMMDEAAQKGLIINGEKLRNLLGIPVLPLIASKGRGVRNLFVTAYKLGLQGNPPKRLPYSTIIEEEIRNLENSLDGKVNIASTTPYAIKLLEGEIWFHSDLIREEPHITAQLQEARKKIDKSYGRSASLIISNERQQHASQITSEAVTQGESQIRWRDQLDNILLHPIFGYIALVIILFLFFQIVYGMGSFLESPLLAFFTMIEQQLITWFGSTTLLGASLIGILQGIAGGMAIVFPYLIPFLLGLGILEDIGYLPRIAFLMDALMNRIGLQGNAIVPFILGYGCNVPAVISTRMIEGRRDRFLVASLATLVPCAARISVIFGLVAFYLGPAIALAIYFFDLLVIAITGRILSGLLPEETPGMILEMPVYRLPTIKTVLHKTWFRSKEFIIEAWPILIVGSLILAVLIFYDLDTIINTIFRPVTWILGLPPKVGLPLIFGILRKELSLIMLFQALGGVEFSVALTSVQLITYAVFVVFYIPCIATLVVLKKELGIKEMIIITGLTIVIAMLAALIARALAVLFL